MPEDQDELLRALHDAHAPALLRYVTRLTYDPALAAGRRAGGTVPRLEAAGDPRAG